MRRGRPRFDGADQPVDLIKFGSSPSSLGAYLWSRFWKSSKRRFVQILTKPKNSIVRQYQKLFEFENVRPGNYTTSSGGIAQIGDGAPCGCARPSDDSELNSFGTDARSNSWLGENLNQSVLFEALSRTATTGKRPMNSGMNPNLMRSTGWICSIKPASVLFAFMRRGRRYLFLRTYKPHGFRPNPPADHLSRPTKAPRI